MCTCEYLRTKKYVNIYIFFVNILYYIYTHTLETPTPTCSARRLPPRCRRLLLQPDCDRQGHQGDVCMCMCVCVRARSCSVLLLFNTLRYLQPTYWNCGGAELSGARALADSRVGWGGVGWGGVGWGGVICECNGWVTVEEVS